MKFLRRVQGCIRIDRLSNEEMRNELNIERIHDSIIVKIHRKYTEK